MTLTAKPDRVVQLVTQFELGERPPTYMILFNTTKTDEHRFIDIIVTEKQLRELGERIEFELAQIESQKACQPKSNEKPA